jgi:hypothetical protein
MYYSEEQILTSLHIIKTVCSGFKAQDCKFCPFGNINGNCIIRFNMLPPSEWKLNDNTDATWRAFVDSEEEN